jgi:hypothetical protein
MSDHLKERANAMESLFYKRQDQELLQRIRDERVSKELRDQLSAASGLTDTNAIDSLAEVGVTADSLTAVAMIPLVSVAWADREMQGSEKDAILQAADASGIDQGSSSYELLATWLNDRPDSDLLDAWKSYIQAVKEKSEATMISQLKSVVLGKAKEVAEAAGGILGFGNKTSAAEQKVLDDLESAF